MSTQVMRRPYRGSRVSSFYPVKSLPPLSSLDSAFQLQEYISLLIRLDVHDVDAIVSLPEKSAPKDHDDIVEPPEPDSKKSDDADRKTDISVDRACWIYEQLRRLAQDLSHPLITMLQQECTRSSCPQMKAGEWLYLCVAHGNDGAMEQCCAIDYILHTVDSATALLNSPRAFPSRLSIPQTSHRHFSSLARRLGRIFAHAYFHHREAFEQAEVESSLYARFLKLTSQFDLVPPEFLVIPESAIHHDDKTHSEEVEPPRLLSAAVHPTPNIRNDTLATDTVPDVGLAFNGYSRTMDAANQIGADSPRKLGRNRTDTMVFSEALNMAEELSKSEDGGRFADGSLLDDSPATETQSLVPAQPWSDLQTGMEDLDDEDIGDGRSDLTRAPLSPPVEAISLISLEDTSCAPTPNEAALPLVPEPSLHESLSNTSAIKSSAEESIQVKDASEDNAPTDPSSTSELVEPPLEEANAATSEVLIETMRILHEPEENVPEVASEDVDPVPLATNEEPKGTEGHAESELPPPPPPPPPPPEPVFELNAPPPSEPIPPESESDITDEFSGDDGHEIRGSGEEEAIVGEQNLVGCDGAAAS